MNPINKYHYLIFLIYDIPFISQRSYYKRSKEVENLNQDKIKPNNKNKL